MKGIIFFEEFRHKRANKSAGNVCAILIDTKRVDRSADGGIVYDAIGAVFEDVNSPVASTNVSIAYLSKYCKRISETRARELHPQLFAYLDSE